VKLMKHFNHENLLGLLDIINPRSKEEFEDLYLVMPYMNTDLHRLVRSETDYSEDHVAYMVYQILCGLKYMHSAHVIHRDLKPGNILVNSDCQVKICDFGLARGITSGSRGNVVVEDAEEDILTEYVVTRWYRAPEVVVAAGNYGYEIDIWSVGCILAELLNRKALFPGDNYIDQLNLILELIGTPTEADLLTITNTKALEYVNALPKFVPKDLKEVIPNASPAAIDLLRQILVFDPAKRITVDEAIKHPFFRKFYNEEKVKETCVCPVFDFSFEKVAINQRAAQNLIFEEIVKFRPYAHNPNMKKNISRISAE